MLTGKDILKILAQNYLVLLVSALLGIVGGFGYYKMAKPVYSASATAYVSVDVADVQNSNSVGSYVSASQLTLQKAQAFLPLFSDRGTAQIIKEQNNLAESPSAIAGSLKATAKSGTFTIIVTAKAATALKAQRLADASIDATSKRVEMLEGDKSPVKIKLLSSATSSAPSVSPKESEALLLGFLAGLAVGIVVVILRATLDTKIRGEDDIKALTDKSILALFPESDTISRKGQPNEDDGAVEVVRKLRTALTYSNVDGDMRSILFTSSLPGEGKSSISLALAKVFAMAGREVILVDCDLRRPTVHRSLGLASPVGLSQVLADAVTLDYAIQESGIPGLKVIVAGQIVPNPSELLGSKKMKNLITELSKRYIVIMDGPPLLPVTDSLVLAGIADSSVLVARANTISKDSVRKSLELLGRSCNHLAGVVINCVKPREMSKYGYSSKYGYGYAPHEQAKNRKSWWKRK